MSFDPAALTDARYEVERGLAWITIDRPERYNAFRARTVDELIACFKAAWPTRTSASCASPARATRPSAPAATRSSATRPATTARRATGLFEIETLHRVIRDIPKPVIAAVNGIAIGGGHVLHVVCDLTIAAEHARFGQAGPRVGSFDAGFGSRLPRAHPRREARARDLVPVPPVRRGDDGALGARERRRARLSELRAEVRKWADEMLAEEPHRAALPQALVQRRQRVDRGHRHALASRASISSCDTPEAREGVEAFAAKRKPDFSKHRK